MGQRMRSHNWNETSLGRLEQWPPCLKTVVSLCLHSLSPSSIGWGPHFLCLHNDAFHALFGTLAQTPSFGRPYDQIYPSLWRQLGEPMGQVLRSGQPLVFDDFRIEMEKPGQKEEGYYSFSFSPIRDDAGAVGGLFVLVQDTTHKKAGEELRQRLASLNETLQERVKTQTGVLHEKEKELQQAQKLEAIGRLAGGVAHDINNLMTGILGTAEDVKDRAGHNLAILQDAEQIINAAHRAFGVTKQLLAFARRQVIQPTVLDMKSHVAELMNLLQRLLGEDIRIQLNLAAIEPIKVDPSHLDQVIMNLAINARDAMPNGGTLGIRTQPMNLQPLDHPGYLGVPAGNYSVLEVSDTGCGMTPETLDHIFEPFFTTKERDKGTGLGLSTVYGIVKQNGGGIQVTSAVGQGTTFKLFFPAVPLSEREPERPEERRPLPDGRETILVIEDEEIVRRVVTRKLTQKGYKVLQAANGKEACELAQSQGTLIDLVLTDVVMPDMNGREAVDRIRLFIPRVAVLFMSGYPEDVIAHRGVLDSGIDFIEKSEVRGDALVRKVQDVLRKSRV